MRIYCIVKDSHIFPTKNSSVFAYNCNSTVIPEFYAEQPNEETSRTEGRLRVVEEKEEFDYEHINVRGGVEGRRNARVLSS